NGRLSDGSFRNYRRLSRFTQPMFSRLSYVGAQTKTYAQRFAQCGTPGNRIETTGSIKFDNVEFERRHESVEQKRSLVSLTGSHTTLVVGSTQSPEERTAVEAFLQLRDQFPELRLIIVPRHPDRFERVFDELQAADVRLIRRSEIGSAIDAEKWEVLLVDTVGELRWWWGVADLAIVGGSFGTRGGQNMIEPAAFGANTAFGPNTSNFRDVVSLLLENDAAEVISDLADMSDWIGNQLKDPHPGRRRAHNAVQIVRPQQGATGKTIASLSALLADSLRGRTHNPNAPRTELPLKDVSRASTTTDRAA
ncbi:MAG: glycosyltransferase N-terminal domain-containing protein, partial [Planctomycetota bacterium]